MRSEQAASTSGHAHDHHAHDPGADITSMYTREYWDERYGSADMVWSGNVNPHLAATASYLTPGAALDVGSGEGADAIWLAANGWQVTGIDVSVVALDRAAARAAVAGTEIAGRIAWQPADVLSWDPAPQRFDLVSAQFMHLPRPALSSLHQRLANAVRPGGTLLVVGHHPSDLDSSMRRPHLPDLMFTAEQMATVLNPDDWELIASAPERQTVDPDGQPVTMRDAVLRAVRRN